MKAPLKILIICSMAGLLFACGKKNNFPDEPVITFKDFTITGDSALLSLKFTDGDGDLGLSDSQIDPPYDYNVFITYFEKRNGVFVERILPFPFAYRIPTLNNTGKEKQLQGEVHITVAPTYYDPTSKYDTIRYDLYIQDRALNKSNIITTPEIIIER